MRVSTPPSRFTFSLGSSEGPSQSPDRGTQPTRCERRNSRCAAETAPTSGRHAPRFSAQAGYTLIELLVVMTLLGLIMGALASGFTSATRTMTYQTRPSERPRVGPERLSERMRTDIHCASGAEAQPTLDALGNPTGTGLHTPIGGHPGSVLRRDQPEQRRPVVLGIGRRQHDPLRDLSNDLRQLRPLRRALPGRLHHEPWVPSWAATSGRSRPARPAGSRPSP